MHKCDTKTKKRSPFYNSCPILRMSNYQVQVAEVLPLYAKGTGKQGVCWVKSSLNIEIKKITGWRNNRKIDWYEDVFLLCYAKQNVLWVALLMSFTRLMLTECSLFYIVKHQQFFSKIYRPYEQSDMQTGTEWPIVTIYVYSIELSIV